MFNKNFKLSITQAASSAGGTILLTLIVVMGIIMTVVMGIHSQAYYMRDHIVPAVKEQQAAGIQVGQLSRFSEQVLTARLTETQNSALAGATEVGKTLTDSGIAVDKTIDSVTNVFNARAESAKLHDEIEKKVKKSQSIIYEIEDILAAAADDTTVRLKDRLKKIHTMTPEDLKKVRSQTTELLQINAASSSLLGAMADMRTSLALSISLPDNETVKKSITRFNSQEEKARTYLSKLPSTGDYEYLPDLLDDFVKLASVFNIREQMLDIADQNEKSGNLVRQQLGELVDGLSSGAAQQISDAVQEVEDKVDIVLISAVTGIITLFAMFIAVGVATRQFVIAPLVNAAKILASGDTKAELPQTYLREYSVITDAVETSWRSIEMTQQLEQERVSLADKFEQSVQGLVYQMASGVEQMSEVADTMSSSSEDLTEVVSDISSKVNKSADIAENAVNEAYKTSDTVNELNTAATEISQIIDVITDIADKTRLLALNASIEAARAGDAGRGFAVVAEEVGNLAAQTSGATQKIIEQVKSMQQATGGTVEAIAKISTIVAEVKDISAEILAAVTGEGSVDKDAFKVVAAKGLEIDSSLLAEAQSMVGGSDRSVKGVSEHTADASRKVLDTADQLAKQTDELGGEIERFLRQIRGG